MNRVPIKPELLRWARQRNRLTVEDLQGRFPQLAAWERGEMEPTLRQLEAFAKAAHTPVGYFFLEHPPSERIPLPDFRTLASQQMREPSPDLLDTIYICQQRQEWYREFARTEGEPPLPWIGSVSVGDDVAATAARLREALGFRVEQRREMPTWTEALRHFIGQADAMGILVMCSGVVGNNTRRHLNPEEFRGFAMADDLAPLIFINGADTKAAQMFTLAHEVAHLWLGQSALSDSQPTSEDAHATERWCNQVAAEFLVPLACLEQEYRRAEPLYGEVSRLARHFKVSSLVVLRRIFDAGGLPRPQFWQAYRAEVERLRRIPRGGGGNFYLSQAARISKRFAAAVVISTVEGRTLYQEAFRLLGFSRLSTFQELGRALGVGVA